MYGDRIFLKLVPAGSWKFLRSNKLEKSKFKLDQIKLLGFRNMQERLEKYIHFEMCRTNTILKFIYSEKATKFC